MITSVEGAEADDEQITKLLAEMDGKVRTRARPSVSGRAPIPPSSIERFQDSTRGAALSGRLN